jgi:hypothetical protein
MFAPEHDFDTATQSFMRNVAQPLAGVNLDSSLWKRQKFGLRTYLGERATKSAFEQILRGTQDGTPAFLFSGSHGMQFALGDPRQQAAQGALVCQDWQGFGKISDDQWFAAADVPGDAQLHGMVHFLFACHGGGCPEVDTYDRWNNELRHIAPRPFFAQLPQAMLAHPQGGALATLAHIDRAWTYSFEGQRGGPQVQGFRDVIGRLLRGERIGQATDMFNIRWAALSTQLADLHLDVWRGAQVPTQTLGNLWVARDDARNFMILGDPAARLRVEDMPPSGSG